MLAGLITPRGKQTWQRCPSLASDAALVRFHRVDPYWLRVWAVELCHTFLGLCWVHPATPQRLQALGGETGIARHNRDELSVWFQKGQGF